SPRAGAVGSLVTLTGTNLPGASSVTFGGVAASPTVISATQVRATVPADAETGQIGVTTPGGTAQSASVFKVLPKLSSFSPLSGAAGARVTLGAAGPAGGTGVQLG